MQQIDNQSQQSLKKEKTKQDYSRNVKKLKYKLEKISQEIQLYENKIKKLSNTSNDQVIAMKISKFCKDRKFTPEMLFRLADTKTQNVVSRMQFRNTLAAIGLKLSLQEATRLEYLLDEDIKGDISLLEYSKYLHAFGLKQEYSTEDPFVKETLKKLDFNKMLDIANKDLQKEKGNKRNGHRVLLNYEEFLKYCHKHFSQLSDKQLGIIFKKLSRDYVVDLEDLIEYIKNMKDEQDRIDRKNKKEKQKQKQKQKQNQQDQEQLPKEEQQQSIDITTLKGKIMAILKQHPQLQQTFHCSQFKRVQKGYKLQRGSMVGLFRQMDTKISGSIGYNQLIVYFVDKQTYKPNNDHNVKYAFILMGKKMQSRGQKPEALVQVYAKDQSFITFEEFKKLCLIEFQLKEQMARKLYEVILACPGARTKDNHVDSKLFVSLMKLNRRGFRNNFKPIIKQEFKQFMYKRHFQTICNNGMVSFKLCRSIVEQLSKVSSGLQKWDDPQFGPTQEDSSGLDSIGTHITNPNVRWIRASQLKMKQFFLPSSINQDEICTTTPLCQNQLFHKSMQMLVKYHPEIFHRQSSEIVKQKKKIQQSQLLKLFEGLHPLIFHQFESWGIYVIQFFVKNNWVNVMVDDKIPCGEDRKPLFGRAANKGLSYVSLVQKAYAKLKGSYEKTYESPSLAKNIYELSAFLTYGISLDQEGSQSHSKNLWQTIYSQGNKESQTRELQKWKQKKFSCQSLFLANQSMCDIKSRQWDKSGLKIDSMLQVYFSTEIKDQNSSTNLPHRLTLLNCPYKLQDEEKWNPKWNVDSSAFKSHSGLIKSEINKWDNSNQNKKIFKNGKFDTIIVDFQLMKEMFNTLCVTKKIYLNEGDQMIALRKELQFEKNFSCLYKLKSKDNNRKAKLIILLNKIRAPSDAKIIVQMKNAQIKKDQPQQIRQKFIMKGEFACFCLQLPTQEQDLEIKVDKFKPEEKYIYQLSFYFDTSRYSLKERDRHLLFRKISENEERSQLDFDILSEEEKKYFYQQYFPNAGRKGFLCC